MRRLASELLGLDHAQYRLILDHDVAGREDAQTGAHSRWLYHKVDGCSTSRRREGEPSPSDVETPFAGLGSGTASGRGGDFGV